MFSRRRRKPQRRSLSVSSVEARGDADEARGDAETEQAEEEMIARRRRRRRASSEASSDEAHCDPTEDAEEEMVRRRSRSSRGAGPDRGGGGGFCSRGGGGGWFCCGWFVVVVLLWWWGGGGGVHPSLLFPPLRNRNRWELRPCASCFKTRRSRRERRCFRRARCDPAAGARCAFDAGCFIAPDIQVAKFFDWLVVPV